MNKIEKRMMLLGIMLWFASLWFPAVTIGSSISYGYDLLSSSVTALIGFPLFLVTLEWGLAFQLAITLVNWMLLAGIVFHVRYQRHITAWIINGVACVIMLIYWANPYVLKGMSFEMISAEVTTGYYIWLLSGLILVGVSTSVMYEPVSNRKG